jgi:hypothetical protein
VECHKGPQATYSKPAAEDTDATSAAQDTAAVLLARTVSIFTASSYQPPATLEKYHERKEPLQVVWGLDGESDFT